jgi:3-hydroxyacyl-CoA dehydrogenase
MAGRGDAAETTGAAVVEGELRGMAAPSGRAPTVRGAIRKMGVVGAGVMGAGIAAHAANAGAPVVLLDIVPGAAAKAVKAMLKADPAPFMNAKAARLVATGDLASDLGMLGDCDWIVEAIVERPEAKRELYGRLQGVRKPGSVVSSNTSTIPLRALLEGTGEGFARDFLITHFFNPPRYMRLLETGRSAARGPSRRRRCADFARPRDGKTSWIAATTPGFIAKPHRRLWIQSALNHAHELR